MAQTPDPPPQTSATPRPPRPAVSPDTWAALDAEYRPGWPPAPEGPAQLPTSGVSGRFWHMEPDVPADPRLRVEGAVLLAWVLVSCFWQGFFPWSVMALALIAYALVARPAFRQVGLGTRPWVYCALAAGQLMLAASFATNLGPFWPFVGLYWLGLIVTWTLVELRSLVGKRRGGRRS